MEKERYFSAIISGIVFTGILLFIGKGEFNIEETLLLGYTLFSTITSLIWWRGLPAEAFRRISINLGWGTLQFAFSFFISGSAFLAVIGVILLCLLGSFCLSCIGFGLALAILLSIFTFPFALVKYAKDLY